MTRKLFEGRVTRRHFRYTHIEDRLKESVPAEKLEWTESEDELYSHQGTSAAEAITLDEVYKRAKNDWLKIREDASVFFEANNNGLISSCGFINDGCQDDCFSGITISKIEPIAQLF